MNTTELLAALRYTAWIGDASAYTAYTDARLLLELDDKLNSVFGDIIIKARNGYWAKQLVTSTVIGRSRYRIPYRACVGGLEKIEVADSTNGAFYRVREVPESEAQVYAGPISGNPGQPRVYTIEGDQIVLMPTPDSVLPLRFTYYLRPSKLVPQQSSGTVRGLVTAVNPTLRTMTVAALPFDQSLAVPSAITSALQLIDVVHPNGWHELGLVNAQQTIAGVGPFTITVGGTADLSDIEVGDFVRAADQTDWPCLPDDYHRALADVAAIKVMIEQSRPTDAVEANVTNDLTRFRSLLLPRVKAEPKTIPVSLKTRGYSRSNWVRF
jgi:hypothetical protein